MSTPVVRHESELGWWEMVRSAPHPSLRPHVREYIGWFEHMAAPLCRRELPTEEVPVMMRPNIFPAVRYKDGHAAIEWLVRAFGFEKQAVYDAPDGTVAHAQLRFGPGVFSISPIPTRTTRARRPQARASSSRCTTRHGHARTTRATWKGSCGGSARTSQREAAPHSGGAKGNHEKRRSTKITKKTYASSS